MYIFHGPVLLIVGNNPEKVIQFIIYKLSWFKGVGHLIRTCFITVCNKNDYTLHMSDAARACISRYKVLLTFLRHVFQQLWNYNCAIWTFPTFGRRDREKTPTHRLARFKDQKSRFFCVIADVIKLNFELVVVKHLMVLLFRHHPF